MTERVEKTDSVKEMIEDLKSNGIKVCEQPQSIKIPIKTLINSRGVLYRLSEKELSVKNALLLAKLLKNVQTELDDADNVRISLLERLSEGIDKEKNEYILKDEKRSEFIKKTHDLFGTEVILHTTKIDLSEEDIKMSTADILALEDFVCIKS